ncbi:MAG: transcriptional regulator, MarR family [Rubritepida sp.]|nr:transcriptional regulator, MarR family [Rubritepida sp.]
MRTYIKAVTELPDRRRITAVLLQASRRWRRLAEEAMTAHGLSEARAAPLIWVGRLGGGVRQVTLAAHIGIEGPSLVRLLDQLEGAGLLERRDDPEDRRAKTI